MICQDLLATSLHRPAAPPAPPCLIHTLSLSLSLSLSLPLSDLEGLVMVLHFFMHSYGVN